MQIKKLHKSVFISRTLRADSTFHAILEAEGFSVLGKSLVEFSAIEFSTPPAADWVFCYSSRSAGFFLKGLDRLGISPSNYPKYAAMGSGTAASLKKNGCSPSFVGNGEAKTTAQAFFKQAQGKRVLFPRAVQSRQSVQRLLKNEIEVLDLVVYENQIIQHLEIPETFYVVLTSPLNAQAYFSQPRLHENHRIVAIGTTTANALKLLGINSFKVASQPSEAALVQTILDWEIDS